MCSIIIKEKTQVFCKWVFFLVQFLVHWTNMDLLVEKPVVWIVDHSQMPRTVTAPSLTELAYWAVTLAGKEPNVTYVSTSRLHLSIPKPVCSPFHFVIQYFILFTSNYFFNAFNTVQPDTLAFWIICLWTIVYRFLIAWTYLLKGFHMHWTLWFDYMI